jgi:Cu(I)/Ag(I) efflux system periplasmic protein CusF
MKRRFTIAFSALALLALFTRVASAQAPMTPGEVTKIDQPTGRVTLKHGEIKHLDMPPMTMVFRVADPKMLDGLQVGNRIRFVAERVNGQYTITHISKAP